MQIGLLEGLVHLLPYTLDSLQNAAIQFAAKNGDNHWNNIKQTV